MKVDVGIIGAFVFGGIFFLLIPIIAIKDGSLRIAEKNVAIASERDGCE